MGGEEHRQDPAPPTNPPRFPVPRIRARVRVQVPAGRRLAGVDGSSLLVAGSTGCPFVKQKPKRGRPCFCRNIPHRTQNTEDKIT